MGVPARSIAVAVAFAAAASAQADALTSELYDNIVVFGDSLSDAGNAGIFTSPDPDGIIPMQPAISFTAQDLGLAAPLPSCSGLGPSSGGAIPCAPAAGTVNEQLQQIVGSVLTNGSNWAVGGNLTADVLLDVVGPERFRALFPDANVADLNNLNALLPDSTRCGDDGVCDPALGESPYLTPLEAAQVAAVLNDDAALQALVDDPSNSITLTGVPFATGQGYLQQNRPSRDTLYYLNGGGNDIIDRTIEGTISPVSMQRSAIFLATAVKALRNAGARYIAVSNAPRVGNTPAMNDLGQPAVDAANSGTAFYNRELLRFLGRIGNVLVLDTEGIGVLVQGNPTLFGFADIDQAATCYAAGACANPNPIYSEGGSAPNADRLLFNDGVHPTLAAGELLGDYYASVLAAPVGFGLLPDMGYQNTRLHQSNIDHHLVAQRYREPTTTMFFGAAGQDTDLGFGPTPNHDGNGWDGFLGFSFAAAEHFEWALALSYAGNDYNPRDLSLKARNLNLSALARWDDQRWFVDGGFTYSDIDYREVDRQVHLGSTFTRRIEGDTDGSASSFFARAGYDSAPALASRMGPFISATWTRVDVDGFHESTQADLTYAGFNGMVLDPIGLHVHRQHRDYYRARAGFFYSGADDADWRWFGELWIEHNGGDDTADLRIGIKSMRNNSARMRAYDSRDHGFFQNGAGALVGLNLTEKLQVSGNVMLGKEETLGGLNLNYRF